MRARLIHRAWRYRLRTESPEGKFLLEHLEAGQTALDLGAHKGALSYWMCRRVRRSGKVIAFEPLPELAAYLRHIQRVYPLPQLKVVRGWTVRRNRIT